MVPSPRPLPALYSNHNIHEKLDAHRLSRIMEYERLPQHFFLLRNEANHLILTTPRWEMQMAATGLSTASIDNLNAFLVTTEVTEPAEVYSGMAVAFPGLGQVSRFSFHPPR